MNNSCCFETSLKWLRIQLSERCFHFCSKCSQRQPLRQWRRQQRKLTIGRRLFEQTFPKNHKNHTTHKIKLETQILYSYTHTSNALLTEYSIKYSFDSFFSLALFPSLDFEWCVVKYAYFVRVQQDTCIAWSYFP